MFPSQCAQTSECFSASCSDLKMLHSDLKKLRSDLKMLRSDLKMFLCYELRSEIISLHCFQTSEIYLCTVQKSKCSCCIASRPQNVPVALRLDLRMFLCTAFNTILISMNKTFKVNTPVTCQTSAFSPHSSHRNRGDLCCSHTCSAMKTGL